MLKQMSQFACLTLAVFLFTATSSAQIAFGPDFDPNDNGAPLDPDDPFDVTDLDTFGVYNFNDSFQEPDGNDAAAIFAGVVASGSDGATVLAHISNGENGNDGDDPMNPDIMNPAPPNSVFGAIGNPSGRLENGNVVRYSMWMRIDPNDLVGGVPQVEPIVKLEFWTEARSVNGDFNPGDNPNFGDRLFDNDQNGGCLFGGPGEVCPGFVDMDGNGTASGPVVDFTLTPDAWTLVSTEYEVDDTGNGIPWGYNLGTGFVPKTVSDVEEIRPVMFLGDFASTDLTNGGTLLVDNPMLEIYRSSGDVPATIPNPPPAATTTNGDFDGNGLYECADVNDLVGEIVAGTNNPTFDLTGNGTVDIDDLTAWRTEAGAGVNAPQLTVSGNPVQEGDANLDGTVDGQDFIDWNASKFTSVAEWCSGDFNADGFVDGQDFIIWNTNKFTSADHTAVPEPSSALLLVSCGLLMLARRTKD